MHLTSLSTGTRRLAWPGLLIMLVSAFIHPGSPLSAQEATTRGPIAEDATPYVLHVYTNLFQLPTLVISRALKPLPPIAKEQFTLSLDSGPPFHPLNSRLQGDDPMTVALLIDTGYPDEVFHNADEAFANLALTSRDRVVIFAVDCAIVRASGTIEPRPESIRQGVRDVLAAPNLHGSGTKKRGCRDNVRLWDAFAAVERELDGQPGRRVILALTQGRDQDSVNKWREVLAYAHSRSIAIFAVRDQPPGIDIGLTRHYDAEDPLLNLCGVSGGVVLDTVPKSLTTTLNHAISLLRGRYILEFQRPSNITAGHHGVDVKIPNHSAYVRTSGVTALLPGEATMNDPNTIPTDTSRAPTVGTRKPIKAPH